MLSLGVHYDEAYTALNYALPGFGAAVSTYDLPNNHIFNSVLLSWLFEFLPATVRNLHLVSFVAFLLSFRIGFSILKRDINARWFWLFLFAAQLPLIHYAIEARGYMLNVLFALLTMSSMEKYRLNKRRRHFARALLWTVLGLWAQPSYLLLCLIPFLNGVVFWREKKMIFEAMLWTVVLFLPALIYVKLFGTKLAGEHLSYSEFFRLLPTYLLSQLKILMQPSSWIVAGGLFLLLVFGDRWSKIKLAALFFVPVMMITLAKVLPPYDRVWLAWLALATLWSAAGWGCLIRRSPVWVGSLVATVIAIVAMKIHQDSARQVQQDFATQGALISIERELSQKIRPGDFVALPIAYKDQLRYLAQAQEHSFLHWRLFPVEEKWRLGVYLVYDDRTPLRKPSTDSVIWVLQDEAGEVVANIKSLDLKTLENRKLSGELFKSGGFRIFKM